MKRYVAMLAVAMLAGATQQALAVERTYQFGVSDQRTNITFQSETDFEVVLGSTRSLSGNVTADLKGGRAQVELEVPLSSLRTGIELRDQHLLSPMWLDAEKYPNISFVSSKARRLSGTKWQIEGTFTMHGVSREMTVKADVREIPAAAAKKAGLEDGDWVRVTVPFQVKLSDFGVEIPEMASAKVNDTWRVQVQAFATTG